MTLLMLVSFVVLLKRVTQNDGAPAILGLMERMYILRSKKTATVNKCYIIMRTDEQVRAILERYGTSRTYCAKASDSWYYDFMVGDTKIHIRFSDHFKDEKDEKDYHIIIVKSSDAYVLRYRKLTITKPADEFPAYLESFMFVFPDMFHIVESSLEQVAQNCQQYLDLKTQYESLRREYTNYKETHGEEDELVKKLKERDEEIKTLTNIKDNLESSARRYKDRVKELESGVPGFLLLNEVKDVYGQVIESANLGLMKVKELRKNLESELKNVGSETKQDR